MYQNVPLSFEFAYGTVGRRLLARAACRDALAARAWQRDAQPLPDPYRLDPAR